MTVFLVHHADAVGPDVDPQRPLSLLGQHQVERVATRIHESGFSPAVVWHSGKLRSRQTAEVCLRVCNPFAEFRMIRGLRSEDPPEWLRDELAADTREILLVGHMPHIADLASLLGTSGQFPLNGAIGVSRDDAGLFREIVRFVS